jgi:hypothetical protein
MKKEQLSHLRLVGMLEEGFSHMMENIIALAWMSGTIAGLQSLFFAMWFDMEYNRELR